MQRRVAWSGSLIGALTGWAGATSCVVCAMSLQIAEPGAPASEPAAIDAAGPAQATRDAAPLTDIDLIRRYQTADVDALSASRFQGSFLSSSTLQTDGPAAASPDGRVAERSFAGRIEASPSAAGADSGVEAALPNSKLGPLFAAILLVLVLGVFGFIGYKLRSHAHKRHRAHRPSGDASRRSSYHSAHHGSHRSAHRFIAYDADRQ